MHKCHDYQDTPECESTCQEGYPKTLEEDKTYGVSSYSVRGEKNIMKEIYENGSVEGTFTVYEDFGDYEKGIYHICTDNNGHSRNGTRNKNYRQRQRYVVERFGRSYCHPYAPPGEG
jgi:hypothetical protein